MEGREHLREGVLEKKKQAQLLCHQRNQEKILPVSNVLEDVTEKTWASVDSM